MSNKTVEHEYDCKSLVVYSSLVAVACDTVGHTLRTYSRREIDKYYEQQRKQYPICHKNPKITGRNGPNSYLYINTLEALSEINPVEISDIPDFLEEWKQRITLFPNYLKNKRSNNYIPWLNNKGGEDCGAYIPIALALGQYCAVVNLPPSFLIAVIESMFTIYVPLDDEAESVKYYASAVQFLYHTGYFGHDLMNRLYENLHINTRLGRMIRILNANALDAEFYSKGFDLEWTINMTYSEELLSILFYYMLRVDTAYVGKGYRSSPRAQWAPIMRQNILSLDDVGFAYGGFCTASEHKHPLVKKELRESNDLCGRIKEVFTTF